MSASTVEAMADQHVQRAGFGRTVASEWIKLWTVRSTWWILCALFVLGAGLTTLLSWGNADWLASADADEVPGSFITWGMMIAQICAVIVGVLTVTSEYGTGMIRTTLAATPSRGRVLAAKALVVSGTLLVLGTVTALAGYFGGNHFFEREGIGLALEGDVARAMYGSGLFLGALALFSMAVGFLVRHTAAAISIVLALVFVLGNMVILVPGDFGVFLERVMPGNAGGAIATPVPFNPNLLDTWPSFGIFAAETATLLALAWLTLRRRDA